MDGGLSIRGGGGGFWGVFLLTPPVLAIFVPLGAMVAGAKTIFSISFGSGLFESAFQYRSSGILGFDQVTSPRIWDRQIDPPSRHPSRQAVD